MSGLLILDEVSKSFDGVAAVTGVSFTLPAGGIVAVTGANGAGKTTLLDVISGLHRPDHGTIRLNGRELGGLPPDRVCAYGVGRGFEPVRPFPGLSVEDGVIVAALVRESDLVEARRQAHEALNLVGLTPFCRHPASVLTAGERKRLELARALATRPRLLLLDEPLTGLSAPEREGVLDLLDHIHRHRRLSILIAEPEAGAVAALTDQFVSLDHGEPVP